MTFATDQLTSFVTPLKDLEYTICYYGHKFSNPDSIPVCGGYSFINSSFILAVLALSIRIIQDFKLWRYDKTHLGKNRVWNIGKYFLAFITIFTSFMTTYDLVIFTL